MWVVSLPTRSLVLHHPFSKFVQIILASCLSQRILVVVDITVLVGVEIRVAGVDILVAGVGILVAGVDILVAGVEILDAGVGILVAVADILVAGADIPAVGADNLFGVVVVGIQLAGVVELDYSRQHLAPC